MALGLMVCPRILYDSTVNQPWSTAILWSRRDNLCKKVFINDYDEVAVGPHSSQDQEKRVLSEFWTAQWKD